MLNVVSVEKAKEIIKENFTGYNLPEEKIDTFFSLGRILAEDVYSDENIPAFDRSTVDGFAVHSSDTFGCSESIPTELKVIGEILMGQEAVYDLPEGCCVKISTGGMIPPGADSVVMLEYTSTEFDGLCHVYKSTAPLENITRAGDDIKKGNRILKKGDKISSLNIGALCAAGKEHIYTYKNPVFGIISTGDEIIPYKEKPHIGQIRDINTALITSLLKEHSCEPVNYGIVKDRREEISEVFSEALKKCDAVILSGGSSAGARDMTAQIIEEKGDILFHGLAMKPGKPTILGKVYDKAVFGLPGHPAAAYFSALSVIIPFLDIIRCSHTEDKTVVYPVADNISSNNGREEIICVKIKDGKAFPVFAKSGIISLLGNSDGYIRIARNKEGLKNGEEVQVHLL